MINAVVGLALVPILWDAIWLAASAWEQVGDWWRIRRWHKEE